MIRYSGLLAILFLAGLMLTGCLHPIMKVNRDCWTLLNGQHECACRDTETGQFVTCAVDERQFILVPEIPGTLAAPLKIDGERVNDRGVTTPYKLKFTESCAVLHLDKDGNQAPCPGFRHGGSK